MESSGETEAAHGEDLPSPYMVAPFIILLLMIATGPLLYQHTWEKHYPKISVVLGLVTVLYYLIVLGNTHSLMHTLAEYISFIALLSSLFVASGGIQIKVDRKATPLLNAGLLLFGAIIANIFGTTGASMVLIRPFIKINKNRIKPYHIVFFIFIVSNVGGALTPIGDPPLFLGFLRGVDFFWFAGHHWYVWLPTVLVIIGIFYIIDSFNKKGAEEDESTEFTGKFEFKGFRNVLYLLVVVVAVFMDPAVFSWVPSLSPLPFGIREIMQFGVVYFSYKHASKEILEYNEFDFEPIREVAYLFLGLFATMIPALEWVAYEAAVLGEKLNAGIFYWATGVLSGFLDNTPTFINFLSAEMGKFGMEVNSVQQVHEFSLLHPLYLQAIGIASVFFGAMTYIGNAPNFMVKSISERSGIKMPSFFGFMVKYSIPILIPIYFVVWYILYYGQG
jgi:Na+/H+ antiporter NhaD/arsenite permease-like protein